VDAHRAFLQAAGMSSRTARVLETQPTGAEVDKDLRALVSLAVRITERPAEVPPEEVAVAARAARSPAEYLDAVGVIVAFNFVNRVANALGVDFEISPWIRRFEAARSLELRLTSLLLRALVDLRPRQVPVRPPRENLSRLDALFRGAGLGELPAFFGRLAGAPHLLEVQRALLEEGAKTSCSDPLTVMSTGLVVVSEVQARTLVKRLTGQLSQRSPNTPGSLLKAARGGLHDGMNRDQVLTLRFAYDVTRCSDRISRERVDELRAAGFNDLKILDLVILIAQWNASARLELLLDPLPGTRETRQPGGAGGQAAAPL
jgi:alkylhydroperoxidase family enzyme